VHNPATMMDEELHLQPVQTAGIFRGAVVITVATLVGHLCAPSRCGGIGRPCFRSRGGT
jgi:hypothetical protein